MLSYCCTLSPPAISQPPIGSIMAIAYRAPTTVRARVVKATKVRKAPAPKGRKAPAPKGRKPMKAMKAMKAMKTVMSFKLQFKGCTITVTVK